MIRLGKQVSEKIDLIKINPISLMLIRGAGAAFLIQISGTGIKYLLEIFLARWLGAGQYGDYSSAITMVRLLAVVSGLGLTTAVLKFIPKYLADKNTPALFGIIHRGRQITFLTGVLIALISFWVINRLVSIGESQGVFLLAVWLIPLMGIQNLQTELLRSFRQIVKAYWPPMVALPIIVIVGAFMVYRLDESLSSLTVIAVTAVAMLIVLAIQLIYLIPLIPVDTGKERPSYQTKNWLQVSFPLWLINIFALLLNQGDILLVYFFRSPQEAGIYNASAKTAGIASFVLIGVNAIAAPMIATYHAKEDKASLQEVAQMAAKWAFWPSLFLTVGIAIFAPAILNLFGSEFALNPWSLRILILGQLINASVGSVGYLMSLTGYQNITARVFGIGFCLNIALNLILIPPFGMIGAAIANTTATIFWNLWLYFLVKRYMGIRSIAFGTSINKQRL